MVAFAPHRSYNYYFVENNQKFWTIIALIFIKEKFQTYVKPCQHSKNRHKAYYFLYNHYLGESNIEYMANNIENKLEVLIYMQ